MKEIEALRSQWSGSNKKVVEGINIVTRIYVNPKTHAYCIIDSHIYDKDHDSKTKIDHLLDMLQNAYFKRQLPFRTVLMDSWYASMQVMKAIEKLHCEIKQVTSIGKCQCRKLPAQRNHNACCF